MRATIINCTPKAKACPIPNFGTLWAHSGLKWSVRQILPPLKKNYEFENIEKIRLLKKLWNLILIVNEQFFFQYFTILTYTFLLFFHQVLE